MDGPPTTGPGAPPPGVDPALFTTQDWSTYSDDDHDVWGILYRRRMDQLRHNGSRIFLDGADLIGLDERRVPDLAAVNQRLWARTGWSAVPVTGFLAAPEFFRCLAERRFPTTVVVRTREQLDYLPEPDIFHDVFGHVPLHAHTVFADFLQAFGAVAAEAESEADIQAMARLFWFTVEFGLVREAGMVKVYGSGLISSHGDARNALSDACERRPFSLDAVISQPFEIDRLQDVLFVVDDFEELFVATREARRRLDEGTLTH
jgi:phenylalanine-4-hydroxylase